MDSTLAALEKALIDTPDDLSTHMAYADYLHEKGDPRGEFIQTQIALEDPNRSAADRKQLKAREKELEQQYQREWLGELAPHLLDQRKNQWWETKFQFARGWLDKLEIPYISTNFSHHLVHAPQASLLRHLEIGSVDYENVVEENIQIPNHIEQWDTRLYPLTQPNTFHNLRVFQLGEPTEWFNASEGQNCSTPRFLAVDVIEQMPLLEELYLAASEVDVAILFRMEQLKQLRILMVYHLRNYPLEILANNPSFSNLTHLLLYPHALDDDEPFIQETDICHILHSRNLCNLTHFQCRQSSFSDDGCRELVKSGRLQQLKFLDFRVGMITDEGAKTLADCDDISNLDYLNLSVNQLGSV